MALHKKVRRPVIITLIGIFASGKTKVGRRLAKRLGIAFVDTDDEIVRQRGATCLAEVQNALSTAEFAKLEEEVAIRTLVSAAVPTVISTGGSVVYSARAMRLFYERSHVVNLVAPFKTIKKRVGPDPDARGIVRRPGESLRDVYERRKPLYARYAHRTVDTRRKRKQAASQLATALRKERVV